MGKGWNVQAGGFTGLKGALRVRNARREAERENKVGRSEMEESESWRTYRTDT